jgi:tetratricopeptide (TPR) repeat protein
MKWPRSLRTTRARAVGAAIVAAYGLGVGFLPLFAGPGYEHSVASGLLVPTVTAVIAAIEGFEGRHASSSRSPLAQVARGLETGILFAAVAFATALVHGARVGFCDPLGGLATFALTALSGAALAGAVGSVSALAVAHFVPPRRRRRRLAIAIAAVAPLATAIVAVAYFYFSPAVFAFDPYVGFFSGTLYDEVVDAWVPLLTYRAGTALTLLSIVGLAASLERDDTGRLDFAARGFLALAALAGASSFTLVAFGPRLGHRTTSMDVKRALGGQRSGPRCDVVYPRGTSEHEAALLLRDCEEEIVAVEKRLGAAGPPRVTAFFFADAAQKRALIGAENTYIAKPWRREVYLQIAPYPHPVLGHEIGHVVAGTFASGPFKVGGSFFGLFPNPGLIEGVAVAASSDKDELTPAQWAHAMKTLGLLPPLRRIFGSGFLTANSSIAYTVAGAFIAHLLDTGHGDGVRAWYGGTRFPDAFGRSFDEAEGAWRSSLDLVPLPPEALAVAKARFDRPAIWGRSCPHVVERIRDDAEKCKEEGDLPKADELFLSLLRLDVADPSARLERGRIAGLRGDREGMKKIFREMIEDARTSITWKNRAREALGDELFRQGSLDEARAAYDEARPQVLDEDWARTLDVKSYMTTSMARASTFGRLLVSKNEHREETVAAIILLARMVESASRSLEDSTRAPADEALARYLLARRLFEAKTYDDADAMLAGTKLEDLEVISPRLRREAARLRLHMACLAPEGERKQRVAEALARYRAAPPPNLGRREVVERLAARCGG